MKYNNRCSKFYLFLLSTCSRWRCTTRYPCKKLAIFLDTAARRCTVTYCQEHTDRDWRIGLQVFGVKTSRSSSLTRGPVAPKQPRLESSRLRCFGCPSTDSLSTSTIHDNQSVEAGGDHFFLPDCLHGSLPGSFLLSYLVFDFIFSLFFFVSGPCARLRWPSRQLLSAR